MPVRLTGFVWLIISSLIHFCGLSAREGLDLPLPARGEKEECVRRSLFGFRDCCSGTLLTGRCNVNLFFIRCQHHAIIALGGLQRHMAFEHIGEHVFSRPRQRIAEAAAAGRVELEYIVRLQRIIGRSGRQPLWLGRCPD